MADSLIKIDFFSKMHFLLSFHYSESECQSILEDYDEWFEGEKSIGKSEEEICSHIGNPQKVVHKICSESPTNARKFSILVNNAFLQFICLVMIRMIMELCVLNVCIAKGYSYLYFALLMNILFFITVITIGKRKGRILIKSRKNLCIDILAVFFIIFNTSMVLKATIPVGHYFTFVYEIVICLLYISVIWESRGILKDRSNIYMYACKAQAVISMLFFMINQMQVLYTDIGQCQNLFWGSVAVYVEIFLSVLFYYIIKGGEL